MTKTTDSPYWLALSQVDGIGPKTFRELITIFGSAKKVWESGDTEWVKIGQNKIKTAIFESREKITPTALINELKTKSIQYTTFLDNDYPKNLKEIYDPPPILYFVGKLLPKDDLAVAVVGSRKMSYYGRDVTESIVEGLVASGITIVSGLARGVDACAHKTAISAGGRTIAVLGCGVDICYPPEHKALYHQITQNGAVVSEFAPKISPVRGNFPARNRIISGLSLGIVVTEAAKDSGSLITANCALEQNREVFAVPGQINSPQSVGTLDLIKNGAKLTSSVNDILEELQIESRFQKLETREILPETKEEEIILKILADGPKSVDEVVRLSKLRASQAISCLSILELSGKIKQISAGVYFL